MTEDFRGDLPLTGGPEAVTAAADDFGHIIHRVPSLVAFPACAGAVASVARYANRDGRALVPRGAGHSVYGQGQSDGGIICDMTRLDTVTVEDGRTISAGAGARWSTVLEAALAQGMTPPVLTDYLELTVGGTLAAGGIGGASHVHGPVTDHVRELEVVTPAGERVTCSAGRDPDVFFGALGSGGSGGIITRATLPLIPAPRRVTVYRVPYPDVGTLMNAQLTLAREGRFGYIEGQIMPAGDGKWSFAAEIALFPGADHSPEAASPYALPRGAETEDMSYRDFCHRMAPGVRLLAETGDWYRPHPWFSAFLPARAAVQYVNAALAGLTPATTGPLPTLLYPLRRGPVPAPTLVTPARDELFFAFTILRTTATEAGLAEALAGNERLARAASAAGGTVYGISACPAPQNRRPGAVPAAPKS